MEATLGEGTDAAPASLAPTAAQEGVEAKATVLEFKGLGYEDTSK